MGFLGVGAKIFCGNPPPRNATTADLRRLVKNCGDALNTSCTSGKESTKKHKKRNVYAVRVTFHHCAVLTP